MLITLGGLDFAVQVEGAGPPLVLLHGFTGSLHTWDELRNGLIGGYTLVALDLIGHGDSARPPDPGRYTLDWATRDLLSLFETLGFDRVNLLGYSMGGRIALHFALSQPERVMRLVLESASPGIEDPLERRRRAESDRLLAQRILDRGISEFVSEWEQQPLLTLAPHVPEATRERIHLQRLANDPLGLANSLRGMGAGQQRPLWSALGKLSMPVHLIVGESDFRYREIATRMRALLPNAELSVIERAGHTVHVDQPTSFAQLVKQALAPAECTLSSN